MRTTPHRGYPYEESSDVVRTAPTRTFAPSMLAIDTDMNQVLTATIPRPLPDQTDLDNLNEHGVWYVETSASAATMLHLPYARPGSLEVLVWAPAAGTVGGYLQRYTTMDLIPKMAIRRRWSNTWDGWHEVLTTPL